MRPLGRQVQTPPSKFTQLILLTAAVLTRTAKPCAGLEECSASSSAVRGLIVAKGLTAVGDSRSWTVPKTVWALMNRPARPGASTGRGGRPATLAGPAFESTPLWETPGFAGRKPDSRAAGHLALMSGGPRHHGPLVHRGALSKAAHCAPPGRWQASKAPGRKGRAWRTRPQAAGSAAAHAHRSPRA